MAAGNQVSHSVLCAYAGEHNLAALPRGLVGGVEMRERLIDRGCPERRHLQEDVGAGSVRNEAVALANRDRNAGEPFAIVEAVEGGTEDYPDAAVSYDAR